MEPRRLLSSTHQRRIPKLLATVVFRYRRISCQKPDELELKKQELAGLDRFQIRYFLFVSEFSEEQSADCCFLPISVEAKASGFIELPC